MSVEGIVGFDDDERVIYSLRDHRGPFEHFALTRERLRAQLRPGWCYLLGEAGDPPLSLAPFLAVGTCESCRRVEMFVADELVSGPKGSSTRVRGITSNHAAKIEIPWTAELAALHAKLPALKATGAAEATEAMETTGAA